MLISEHLLSGGTNMAGTWVLDTDSEAVTVSVGDFEEVSAKASEGIPRNMDRRTPQAQPARLIS